MIKPEDLSILLPASEAESVADSAIAEQEEAAVARAINYNANTGEKCTPWNGPLSDGIKSKLKTKGYKVENQKDAYANDIPDMYIIKSR